MPSSRFTNIKSLLPALESALTSFLASKSNFRIIKTVKSSSQQASAPSSLITNPVPTHAKTLFILDSSYNPPSRAHFALAKNVLLHAAGENKTNYRLLLLFSTHNADKKDVDPKQFVHRIAMMVLFAGDLLGELGRGSSKVKGTSIGKQDGAVGYTGEDNMDSAAREGIEIDIGLTKSPYYTDKSLGITLATDEESGGLYYPEKPTHIHLLGYDTVTRFLAAKYYPSNDPPLSAVSPYFDAGHELRVLLRPEGEDDAAENEQRAWVEELKGGSLEKEGFRRNWGEHISVVEGMGNKAKGISSTKIRDAVKKEDWNTVSKLCSEGVVEYVKEMGLYADD